MAQTEVCIECGHTPLKRIGDIKQTRLFLCPECFHERVMYIRDKECNHEEYDTKNNCVHCGKSKN